MTVHDELRAEQQRSRRREHLLEGENDVLKLIVERAPLGTVLNALTRVAERQSNAGLLASVLLMDSDGLHLRHGAAPSLPAAYSNAIDGIAIGPNVGSCGTAAFLGKPVIVTDIAVDPLWKDFRALAMQHGLRACWSSPIVSARGQVLGTFALYYRTPHSPDADDEAMIDILTRTAALAIEHTRAETELAESEERFRSLTRCVPVGVFTTDASGSFTYVNPRFVDISAFEYEKTFEYWLEVAAGDMEAVAGWQAAVARRAEFTREFELKRDGLHRTLRVHAAPLKSRTAEYLGYVGTVEDISQRAQAGTEFRKLNAASDHALPAVP